MLSAYRVLDLTDERGQMTGQILRSLGAEVILIEAPEGSRARRIGPFAGDIEDPERSLPFWSYNRGKKSVVLDLDSDDGRAQLRRLAEGADFLIESAEPGVLASKGLGFDDLATTNPALIYLSISAFGSDGPRASWAESDLTVLASSGQLVIAGDADRPPVRPSLPQAYYHVASEAAGAALIALYERQTWSGLGQFIDLSAQQSVNQAAQSTGLAHPLNATPTKRFGSGVKAAGLNIQLLWACADGHVSVTFLFGGAVVEFTQNLMNWVCEEGFCDEATRDKNWLEYGVMLADGREPVEEYERVKGVLSEFFATKTKNELLEQSFAKRLLIAPVTTTQDVLESTQLAAREFWDEVDHGELGTIRYPGAIAKFSKTPLGALLPAPQIGAHTDELLAESARSPVVAVTPPNPATGAPLAGLKILDLMWYMAGPGGSRVLADYGAEIVRVESANKIDGVRTQHPFRDDNPDPEWAGLWSNLNAGKMGLALDMSKPGAIDVVKDLVAWADVLLESFSPKGMKKWGLDYESLLAINPNIVMLSSCLMGQTGPHSSLVGFGTMAAAIAGFTNIAGWTDRAPCGPFMAYTDYVSPRFLVIALLAAIEHWRATGEGQHIDISQCESALHLLTPALLEFETNGRIWERDGNNDRYCAPHGVYPAAGDDRWVAIACKDDGQWRQLCAEMGRTDLADLTDRLDRRAELDEVIASWTSKLDAATVMEKLQAQGVPAHVVQESVDLWNDPQLAHRQHYREVAHAKQGTTWVEGTRFILSRTPAVIERGGPTYGEHSYDVLTGLLGYDGDRIAELAAAQLLE